MRSNEQDNNSRASADQVWKSLLEDLQQTPLEIPQTWVKDTSAHWDSEELSLIITVPLDTDDDWLERRFLPLANIYFSQDNDKKQLVVKRKGRVGQDDLLVRVQRNAYDQVVSPRKMVPVPFYLFQHWLPVLGSSLFWLVIAIRQQSFVNTTKKGSVHKLISTRELSHWAPLSFSQIAKLLNKEGFSSWFFTKEKDGYQDVPPEYRVWSQIPVAPHHLVWIDSFLNERPEGSAVAAIEHLLDNPGIIRGVNKKDIAVPLKFSKKRFSLADIFTAHFPKEMDQNIYDMVTQLEYQITRENMFLSIPHYFFENYGLELSSNEAALLWCLRSVYKEDGNDTLVFNGYSQIKEALGCSLNTAKNLLGSSVREADSNPNPSWSVSFNEDFSLGNWLTVSQQALPINGVATELSIKIRATEPIHSSDVEAYEALVKEELRKLKTPDSTKDSPVKNDTQENIEFSIPVKNNTPENTESSTPVKNDTPLIKDNTPPVNNDTLPIKDNTGNLSNSTHLKSSYNNSLISSLNDSLIPPLPDINDPDLSTDHKVVGVGNINLEKLLGFGSYKHNEKKKIIDLIEKAPDLFLAWIIRNHITAAKFPVRLAVKNLQERNETENQYLELARLGWEISSQLASVSENDLSMWELGLDDDYEDQEKLIQAYKKLSKPAKKEINKLRETDYSQLVENVK
jgi:hypothetical protein